MNREMYRIKYILYTVLSLERKKNEHTIRYIYIHILLLHKQDCIKNTI